MRRWIRASAAATTAALLLLSGATAAPGAPAGPDGEQDDAALRDVERATVRWVDEVRHAVVGVEPWRGGQPIGFNAGRAGSAVAITTREGATELLTTTGVIGAGVERVRITYPDGRSAEGRVVGRDAVSGAVLIETQTPTKSALPLGRSEPLTVGTRVLTAGSPYGSLHRVHEVGMSVGTITGRYPVAAAEPEIGVADRYQGDVLETDAGVNPGSFGGPLCDRRGRVVGLVVQSLSRSRWLGTAAPIDPIRRRLPALRAGLGRSGAGVAVPGLKARFATAVDGTGVVVLAPGDTPLQVGDIITTVVAGPRTLRPRDADALVQTLTDAGAAASGFRVIRDGADTPVPWSRDDGSEEDF